MLDEPMQAEINREVATHRAMLGIDSMAILNRSTLDAFVSSYETLLLQLDVERRRAEKAERREAQFREWWAGVKVENDRLRRSDSD